MHPVTPLSHPREAPATFHPRETSGAPGGFRAEESRAVRRDERGGRRTWTVDGVVLIADGRDAEEDPEALLGVEDDAPAVGAVVEAVGAHDAAVAVAGDTRLGHGEAVLADRQVRAHAARV